MVTSDVSLWRGHSGACGELGSTQVPVWIRDLAFNLQQLNVFDSLVPLQHDQLLKKARAIQYSAKSTIFHAGDRASNVLIVMSGHVRLARLAESGKEITIDLLWPGDLFGEEVLFENSHRRMNAHALRDACVWSLDAADVVDIAQRDSIFAMKLANIIHERLLSVSTALEDVACQCIFERLLRLFDRLVKAHGIPMQAGQYVGVQLTHRDIALLVGSTRETISKTMGELTRAGAVCIDSDRLVVRYRT